MIGRLTRFELKKTLGGKFFRIALCLMLLLNLLLNCGIREWYEVQDLVRQESSMVDNLSDQQKNNFFALMKSARVVAQVCKENWKRYAQLTPEDKAALVETLKERYGENVLDRDFFVPTDEMINTTGTLEGSDENDLGLIMNLQVVEGRNQDEEENRQRVLKSAKRLSQDAMKNGDSYNIRPESPGPETLCRTPAAQYRPHHPGLERLPVRNLCYAAGISHGAAGLRRILFQ